jgi:predicted ATPase
MFKKIIVLALSLFVSGILLAQETKTEKENYGEKKSSEVNKGQQGELKREQNKERKETKDEAKKMKKEQKKTGKKGKK